MIEPSVSCLWAARGQPDAGGRVVFLRPSCLPFPRALGRHSRRSPVLPSYDSWLLKAQLEEEMNSHSCIRKCDGHKIDWLRFTRTPCKQMKTIFFPDCTVLSQGVPGIRGNWEVNQRRAIQETIKLWTPGHNFHDFPICRFSPPNEMQWREQRTPQSTWSFLKDGIRCGIRTSKYAWGFSFLHL